MEKLKLYFQLPYEEKGIFKATLDFAVRAVTVVIWGQLMLILGRLLWSACLYEFDPAVKLWWFSYCFILFVGAGWITYIILFVRDYYEAEE